MRHSRFLPIFGLAVLLCACTKNVNSNDSPESEGELAFSLSADVRNGIVSKATEETDGPVLDDFEVEIYKLPNHTRLYRDTYANAKDTTIKLNAAEYRLTAQLGDSLGCGFEKPYYFAEKIFTLEPFVKQSVEAVAKLHNVKIKMLYDESFTNVFSEYYVKVRHENYSKKILRFEQTETRDGYYPSGNIYFEVFVKINDEDRYFRVPSSDAEQRFLAANPNDYITFTVKYSGDSGNFNGDLVVDITVDDSETLKEQTLTVPHSNIPQTGPVITLSGFDATGNSHDIYEGIADGRSAQAYILAKGGIRHCWLETTSELLLAAGVPAKVDLANLASADSVALATVGFNWDKDMKSSITYSFVDFTGVNEYIYSHKSSGSADETVAEFKLSVEDNAYATSTDSAAHVANESCKVVMKKINTVLAIEESNVWSKTVLSPKVTDCNASVSLLRLQYSTDNTEWTTIDAAPVVINGEAVFSDVKNLAPGTAYSFRTIYNGNALAVSNSVALSTEAELQLGNAGFENWTDNSFSGSYADITWHTPFSADDRWWDSNGSATLDASYSIAYVGYKCFPTVCRDASDKKISGTYSAVVASISTTDMGSEISSGDAVTGELFIGTADNSGEHKGNHLTEGHEFASRPTALTFKYRFDRHDTPFSVEATVYAEDGSVIASGFKADVNESVWDVAEAVIPLNYVDTGKKAAKIYVIVRSSSTDSVSSRKITSHEFIKLHSKISEIHAGNILWIDDMTLVYEL